MFGIGFTELLLIAVIAILFLGPDKLPEAMVGIAKMIRSLKRTVAEAKTAIEEEVHLSEIKAEASRYRQELDEATKELQQFKNIDLNKAIYESSEPTLAPSKSADPYVDSSRERVATQVEPKMEETQIKRKKSAETDTDTHNEDEKSEGDA